MNKTNDFAGFRIYGLLTDLISFKFYSYDPITNKFCFDETIIINNRRIDAFSDMIDGKYFLDGRCSDDLSPQFPIRSLVSFCRPI